ncbi:MAG: DNA replication/repair protein RecF [Chlamydiales bacterium]
MQILNLYLQNFRSYEEAFFEFSPSLNLICGPNAKGKTSLLEAIHFLMIGRSFRTPQYQDLIKQNQTGFYIESHFTKHGINQRLRVAGNPSDRKMFHNSTSLATLSSLLGLIQGVLQTPDDINLIKGSPHLRRQFLDIQIAQIDPLYVHHLTRYARAMRQRNQLLRNKTAVSIESWEFEMSQSAAYIILQRHRTIQNLQKHSQSFYHKLTGEQAPLTLHYRTPPSQIMHAEELKSYFQKLYQKNRNRERLLGYTLSGPHKDDFVILIDQRDVRFFASEGQQRGCATALHFAEWQNLHLAGTEKPLFMIDDVGMSLDESRRKRLVEQLRELGQVFLTTTDERLLDGYAGPKKTFLI